MGKTSDDNLPLNNELDINLMDQLLRNTTPPLPSIGQVKNCLKRLNPRKATGVDKILGWILKRFSDDLAPFTFDVVNHNILLEKLASMNVSKPFWLWIRSYLTGRTQVNLHGTISSIFMTAPQQSKIHIKSQVRERIGNRESIREGDIGTAPHNKSKSKKIGEFYEKLSYLVQALETMKRLDQVSGNVSTTLDKLPAIRGDLVRTDPDWETWDFLKLTEAQHEWVRRNPVDKNAERERDENKRKRDHHNRLFQARGGDFKVKGCDVLRR